MQVTGDLACARKYRVVVLRAVVEQHVEDAAFLFALRRESILGPAARLEDIARLDERLEANLDGIRIAGQGGAKLAFAALAHGEAGEAFTAAVVACASKRSDRLLEILDLRGADDFVIGVSAALEWSSLATAKPALEALRTLRGASARRTFIEGSVAHRCDPKKALLAAVLDDDARLRATAFAAIGKLGRGDLRGVLAAGLDEEEVRCRFAAAWSAVVLGDDVAGEALRAIAAGASEHAEAAATSAAIALPPGEAKAWIEELAAREEHRRIAIRAAAALGDPFILPILGDWCRSAELARLAAAAIEAITGVGIEGELAGVAPDGFEAGASDDPEDASTATDPDAGLPWPDADALVAAVGTRALTPNVRHLLGRPIDRASLLRALGEARQPERARAAFELARAGEPLFDVGAPAHRQLAALAALGVAAPAFSFDG